MDDKGRLQAMREESNVSQPVAVATTAPRARVEFPAWAYQVEIILSAVFFAVSSMLAKLAMKASAGASTITFSRFAMGFVLLLGWMAISRRGIHPKNVKGLILRGLTNLAAVFMFYHAINYTTITNANLLNLTYPAFVALFSPLLLSQRLNRREWGVLALAGAGIYLVVNPSFQGVNLGDVLGLGAGVMAGFSIIALSLVRRGNSTETVLFFLLGIGSLATWPSVLGEAFSEYTPKTWWLLIACAVTGVLGQFSITAAFKHVTAFTGSIVGTTRVVMAALLGFVFLSEVPGWNVVAGSVVLFIAIWLLSSRKVKRV
jgi:drug/metabolite transporter (DMT)-like permease